jgi:predicted nucleic acid-binding protein
VIHGLDTGFLVAAAVAEHPRHAEARASLSRLTAAGDRFALAPQVLAELIHVITDPRRFSAPLDMTAAVGLAFQWWTAREVEQVFPNDGSTRQFLSWLRDHGLGRKRLLDTLLAATYRGAGVRSLLTTNPDDFCVFGVFEFPETPPLVP